MSVEDDGLGADPTAVLSGDGRGLDLLTQRLGALYGPEASLTWSTEPEKGFSVRCTIPLSRAGTGSAAGRPVTDGGRVE